MAIMVKIAQFFLDATFWKTLFASSQNGIVIKYVTQSKFIY